MKKLPVFILFVSLIALSACGELPAAPAAETPAPTPTTIVTPEPTPDPRDSVTELTVKSADELAGLSDYVNLEYVNADAVSDIDALCTAWADNPDVRIEWHCDVAGKSVSSLDTELDLAGCEIEDTDSLISELAVLPGLERVYLIDSGLNDTECRELADGLPQIRFVWMLHFAEWTVRTDIQCFSTLRDGSDWGRYGDTEFAPLFRYCRDLVALDLGHNRISDLAPIAELSSLRYLILADNNTIRDISPLSKLAELEYLELFMCYRVTDYSALASLEKLKWINLCHNSAMDTLAWAENTPELEMLWIMGCKVPDAELEEYRGSHPDVNTVTYTGSISATDGGWRETEMNTALRNAFTNWRKLEYFTSWDDYGFIED